MTTNTTPAATVPPHELLARALDALEAAQAGLPSRGVIAAKVAEAIAELRLATQAPPAEAVPATHRLVPVEPTWEMQIAGSTAYRQPRDGHYTARMECAADAWRAMLAAATPPKAPEPPAI